MAHLLEHLIAFGQPTEVILKKIELYSGNNAKINGNDNSYKLTPLHLSVLTGRKDLIVPLIKAGADPEKADLHGWKPIHHAALRADGIFQELIIGGANPSAKTSFGGSCEDLRRLSGILPSQESMKTLSVLSMKDKKKVPATEENLPGLKKYCDEVYFSEENLKELWQQEELEIPFESQLFKSELTEACEKWRQNPPQLLIKPTKMLDQNDSDLKIHGCFADEDLLQGAIIGEYGGQYIPSSPPLFFLENIAKKDSHSGYLLGNIEADKMGNVARYCNDGFPNSVTLDVHNVHGLRERKITVACENLNKDTEIFWDYQPDEMNLKWGPHMVLNSDEMHRFFREYSVEMLTKEVESRLSTLQQKYENRKKANLFEEYLTFRGIIGRLFYPMTTPSALIELVFRGTTRAKEWAKLPSRPIFSGIIESYGTPTAGMIQLLDMLINLENIVSNSNEIEEDVVRKWFLQKKGTWSVMQYVKAIQLTIEWADKRSESFEDFTKKTESTLKGYDLFKDKAFPIEFPNKQCSEKTAKIIEKYGVIVG